MMLQEKMVVDLDNSQCMGYAARRDFTRCHHELPWIGPKTSQTGPQPLPCGLSRAGIFGGFSHPQGTKPPYTGK
jgi:hypothetical protein